MHIVKMATLSVFALLLVECDANNSAENREQKITRFFKELKVGSGPDYAVVKLDENGQRSRAIVVFGYMSNDDVCEQIVKVFNRSRDDVVPGTYYCEALN